ncbi:MAG: hypothetical protein IJP52_01845 [Paludibacteraceae bacterium]|nr:hypothetical protein [Paludibacteraceae bacterium]
MEPLVSMRLLQDERVRRAAAMLPLRSGQVLLRDLRHPCRTRVQNYTFLRICANKSVDGGDFFENVSKTDKDIGIFFVLLQSESKNAGYENDL